MPIAFDNSYASLPDRFFARVAPASAPAPSLIRLNHALAADLGLDPEWLAGPDGLEFLSGRRIAAGSDPIAEAYAGHQFGHFVPQLGDGRAILLGEVLDRAGGRRDLQLKGAGRTPFSRAGDGRAALGSVLREYLLSEAMAALDIPTTRALSAVATGETVVRETPLPGASLVRVASSHIRIGTFQFFAAQGDQEAVRLLADHAIARHYPDAASTAHPYRALLDAVIAAQADLVARWLLVGFIHGVMNTDNASIAGETIDYGPCAFLDAYDPAKTFSSIDRQGRYAYGNQPRIAHWYLTRLAETMLPLLADEHDDAIAEAEAALAAFGPQFEHIYQRGLAAKLGLFTSREWDADLAAAILAIMAENEIDFTLFFRNFGLAATGEDTPARSLFADPTAFDDWSRRWRERVQLEPHDGAERRAAMDAVNPALIARNHRVEAMITAAVEEHDFGPFEQLLEALSRPFEDQPRFAHLALPPQPHERVLATFCGT